MAWLPYLFLKCSKLHESSTPGYVPGIKVLCICIVQPGSSNITEYAYDLLCLHCLASARRESNESETIPPPFHVGDNAHFTCRHACHVTGAKNGSEKEEPVWRVHSSATQDTRGTQGGGKHRGTRENTR